MYKIYYVNEKWYEKIARVGKEKISAGWNVIKEHKDEAIVIVTTVAAGVGAASGLIRAVRPSAVTQHDKKIERTYYDPSSGIHWDLRRKANNSDRIELMKRKRNGENVEDILKDLKLIK